MEEDAKKEEAAKMIGSSVTDHQEDDGDDRLSQLPLDSSFFYQLHINEESSQTETETSSKKRKRVAMNNSSTIPVPLPLDSSPNLTPKKKVGGVGAMKDSSTFRRSLRVDSSPNITPKKRKEGPETEQSSGESPTKIKRSKKRKEEPSPTTSSQTEGSSETTSAETLTKKRTPRSYFIDLTAGQDMVDIIYTISQAFPHRTFAIISAIGTISEVGLFTPNGLAHQKGEFEILSLSVRSLVGDDGRHCRAKAKCSVSWIDDKGVMYASTSVNSLIAAGPVKVITAYFNTETAEKAGARISVSPAGARKGDADPKMLVEGQASYHSPTLGILPIRRVVDRKIFPIEATPLQMIAAISNPAKEYCAKVIEAAASRMLADGDLKCTSNDQDMKSPSVGDT